MKSLVNYCQVSIDFTVYAFKATKLMCLNIHGFQNELRSEILINFGV